MVIVGVYPDGELLAAFNVAVGSLLDEIVRDGARQMLEAALKAEVAAYMNGSPTASTSKVAGWWSATVIASSAMC